MQFTNISCDLSGNSAISLLEIILLDKRATALPRYGVDTKKSIRWYGFSMF